MAFPDGLRSIARDRSGATTIENSLLGAIIAFAIIFAIGELGSLAFQIFDLSAQSVEQAANPSCDYGNGNCGNGGGSTGDSGSGAGNGKGGNNSGQGNSSGNVGG